MNNFALSEHGTLKQWRCNGTPLLFEEQWVECSDGDRGLRGGAAVCCPNFGDLPDISQSHEVSMPRHRLVRLGEKPADLQRDRVSTWSHANVVTERYQATFMEPFQHRAEIILEKPSPHVLIHELTITLEEYLSSSMPFVPVSIGVNPYIRTNGKPFMVEHGNVQCMSGETDFDNPNVILWKSDQPLLIKLAHGCIKISLNGGNYTHFCVWSDCPEQYLCVSAFLGYRYPYMLRSGDDVTGRCTLTYDCTVVYP